MFKYSLLTLLPCWGQSILLKFDVKEQMNNRTIPSSSIALSLDSSGRWRSVCKSLSAGKKE